MKRQIVYMSILILLLSFLLSGCHADSPPVETAPVDDSIRNETAIMPNHVIRIGDSYKYYPDYASGHFLCTVTDARVVTQESECPPLDMIDTGWLWATEDGERVLFEKAEWFTEGGAFDRGCRMVLVDLTVTNVDAIANLDDGTFTTNGYFLDPYAFHAYAVGSMVDLTLTFDYGMQYVDYKHDYFSLLGQYSEDNLETLGAEHYAIRILPGETVSYTLGYPVDANEDGSPKDLSDVMFCTGSNRFIKDGVFVDLALGDE